MKEQLILNGLDFSPEENLSRYLQSIKKYPILYNIIDYYLGISENAIFYLKKVVSNYEGNVSVCVCHKRIGVNSTLFDLYNPLNLIIDTRVRDIAEYFKNHPNY